MLPGRHFLGSRDLIQTIGPEHALDPSPSLRGIGFDEAVRYGSTGRAWYRLEPRARLPVRHELISNRCFESAPPRIYHAARTSISGLLADSPKLVSAGFSATPNP